MNLPNVPTDSLYKFLAITGLACVIGANIVIAQTVRSTRMDAESEIQNNHDRVEKRIWDMVDGVRKDRPEKEERTRELNSLNDVVERFEQLESKKLDRRLSFIYSEADRLITLMLRLEYAGYALTPIGFFLWWRRIQRYQDALLKAEYEKELQSSTKVIHNATTSSS